MGKIAFVRVYILIKTYGDIHGNRDSARHNGQIVEHNRSHHQGIHDFEV